MQTIKVTSSGQLQDVFRKGQKEKTPLFLYRQSNGTGTMLDFSRWNQLTELDMDNLIAIVEPGLLLGDFQRQLNEKNLRFVPADTPCYANLSVGEWVYRGCPNVSSWKYGSGKHFLMGGDYVFPNGDLSPAGGKTVKNVTGYDLIRFFAGGYADIAVGTRFVLKLLPQPASKKTFSTGFNSLSDMFDALLMLQQRSVWPAWLMWFDEEAQRQFFGKAPVTNKVVFEIDGGCDEVEKHSREIQKLLHKCNGKTEEAEEALPDFAGLEQSKSPLFLLDEFKVPVTNAAEFITRIREFFKQKKCRGGLFGQLADGKLHLYFEKHTAAGQECIAMAQSAARALGGAATGKYERLFGKRQAGKLIEMEASLKRKVDPGNIFNVLGRSDCCE